MLIKKVSKIEHFSSSLTLDISPSLILWAALRLDPSTDYALSGTFSPFHPPSFFQIYLVMLLVLCLNLPHVSLFFFFEARILHVVSVSYHLY